MIPSSSPTSSPFLGRTKYITEPIPLPELQEHKILLIVCIDNRDASFWKICDKHYHECGYLQSLSRRAISRDRLGRMVRAHIDTVEIVAPDRLSCNIEAIIASNASIVRPSNTPKWFELHGLTVRIQNISIRECLDCFDLLWHEHKIGCEPWKFFFPFIQLMLIFAFHSVFSVRRRFAAYLDISIRFGYKFQWHTLHCLCHVTRVTVFNFFHRIEQ